MSTGGHDVRARGDLHDERLRCVRRLPRSGFAAFARAFQEHLLSRFSGLVEDGALVLLSDRRRVFVGRAGSGGGSRSVQGSPRRRRHRRRSPRRCRSTWGSSLRRRRRRSSRTGRRKRRGRRRGRRRVRCGAAAGSGPGCVSSRGDYLGTSSPEVRFPTSLGSLDAGFPVVRRRGLHRAVVLGAAHLALALLFDLAVALVPLFHLALHLRARSFLARGRFASATSPAIVMSRNSGRASRCTLQGRVFPACHPAAITRAERCRRRG